MSLVSMIHPVACNHERTLLLWDGVVGTCSNISEGLLASLYLGVVHVRPLELQFLQDPLESPIHFTFLRWQASQARLTADEDEEDDSGMVSNATESFQRRDEQGRCYFPNVNMVYV